MSRGIVGRRAFTFLDYSCLCRPPSLLYYPSFARDYCTLYLSTIASFPSSTMMPGNYHEACAHVAVVFFIINCDDVVSHDSHIVFECVGGTRAVVETYARQHQVSPCQDPPFFLRLRMHVCMHWIHSLRAGREHRQASRHPCCTPRRAQWPRLTPRPPRTVV